MKKLFVLIFLHIFLYANEVNLQAKYDVSYGLFGTLGMADAKIKTDKNNNYTISIDAQATGFAKSLSSNLKESYQSVGIFENERFKPYKFRKISSNNSKIKIYEYKFDYEKKQVTLKKTVKKLKNGIWKEKVKKEIVKYWATEDLLSLFFNVKHYIPNINTSSIQSIPTIGVGKKNNGNVDIEIPSGEKRKTIAKHLQSDHNILIVKIYNKVFGSAGGELYLKLDNQGICDLSILKDVLVFGDIVGKRKI